MLHLQGHYLANLKHASPRAGQGFYELASGRLRYYMDGKDPCWIEVRSGRVVWGPGETPRKVELWFYEANTGRAAFSVAVTPGRDLEFA